jgi:hypothetical protein
MHGNNFSEIINLAFRPFLEEMGFQIEKLSISGRNYRVIFLAKFFAVTVSFEPGDKALFVILSSVKNGVLSEFDDPTKTMHLHDLNSRYMKNVAPAERIANDAFFANIPAHDLDAQRLLKAAKELRLVLPMHLKTHDATRLRLI